MDKFISDLEKQGFVAKEKIGFDQIIKHIDRAFLDLKAAKANLEIDSSVSYSCAYLAMLRAGRALMFLFGCRPTDGRQHKTVVLFSKEVLDKEFSDLVIKFDWMRKFRNKFTYDEPGIQVSKQEVQNALKSASQFVLEISDLIEKKNPQIKLIKNV